MNRKFTKKIKYFFIYTLCFGVIGVVSNLITTDQSTVPQVNADTVNTNLNDPDGACDGSPSPSGDCGCGY